MNKKTSSKSKKSVEVKEKQKISSFFKKIQLRRSNTDEDDDDFQSTKVKVNEGDENIKKVDENIKKNSEEVKVKKGNDKVNNKIKSNEVIETDKNKKDEKKTIKNKQVSKVIQKLNVSDDDFVFECTNNKNIHKKSSNEINKKSVNENNKKPVKDPEKKSLEQNNKVDNVVTSTKLITDTTLEKSYLKRDEIALEITDKSLQDITNIESPTKTDKNSPKNHSPPHSTPIGPTKKRKHCDIPDVIPETPEEDIIPRNRRSFEKLNEGDDLIIPDMIVKSPPIKVRRIFDEPKVVVNLSDLTKKEFEEVQAKIYSGPVKEVVKVDIDFINFGNGDDRIEGGGDNKKKDEHHEIRDKNDKSQDKVSKHSQKLIENPKITSDRLSPDKNQLTPEKNLSPPQKILSPNITPTKLSSPTKPHQSPHQKILSRNLTPKKHPSPTKPHPSPSDLNINDFMDDSWDGVSVDVDNLTHTLLLDTWQYCKVLEIKTDIHHNKIIKIESITNSNTTSCILQGVWSSIKLDVNNKINIIAQKTNDYIPYCVNNNNGFVVYEPDILISGTSVVGSLFCKRKGVLSDRFHGADPSNEAMIIGSLVHRVFQGALKRKLTTEEEINKLLTEILSEKDIIYTCYTSDLKLDSINLQCMYFLKKIENFINCYVTGTGRVKNNQNWKGTVQSIEDIEENFWCTSIGIKGKIDVTIKTKPSMVLPLELKTGRASLSLEHRGQVILYTMMMNEFGYDASSGLLLYLRDDLILSEISAKHNEKRDLIMLRNDLAYYLNQKPKIKSSDNDEIKSVNSLNDTLQNRDGQLIYGELPEPIDHPTACKKCPYSTICSIYLHRDETKLPERHPLNEIIQEVTSFLSESHIDYFTHWTSLIQIESSYKSPLKELKDIWRLPPLEREVLGKSVCFLKLSQPVTGKSEPFIHRFKTNDKNSFVEGDSEKDLLRSGLSVGNYVVVSTDKRIAVASGFVTDITKDSISVGLERNLSERYNGCVFHIDTYESQTIFNYNMLSTLTILENNEKAKRLRQLIIDKQPPGYNMKLSKAVALAGGKILKRLNKFQQRAILKALTAQDYLLIKGMPGTGKTATIVALIQLLVELKKTVLVTSHTNAAVDNVCQRLVDCGVDLLRLGSEHRIHPGLLKYSESYKTKDCKTTEDFRRVYNEANVIAVTCLGVHHPALIRRTLNVCIVDESTQVLQCSVLKALKLTETFILIGDPDQLPPVVTNPEALKRGMNESLFERLDTSASTITLTLQYRMNKTITSVANGLTYNGQLLCADDSVGYATLRLPKLERLQTVYGQEMWVLNVLDGKIDKSVVGINTGPTWKKFVSNTHMDLLEDLKVPVKNVQEDEDRACSNIYEVGIVYTIIEALNNAGVKLDTIGVIAPYRAQVSLLKKHLNKLDDTNDIEVNTVDQYQGRDKDVILYSCTRSRDTTKIRKNYTFEILEDKRRLTVAITRAKHKLIIIGDFCTLKQYSPFNKLISCLDTHQIVSLDENPDGFHWEKIMNRIHL